MAAEQERMAAEQERNMEDEKDRRRRNLDQAPVVWALLCQGAIASGNIAKPAELADKMLEAWKSRFC